MALTRDQKSYLETQKLSPEVRRILDPPQDPEAHLGATHDDFLLFRQKLLASLGIPDLETPDWMRRRIIRVPKV